MFTAKSDGERILKIVQHAAKLWARVGCLVFLDSRGIMSVPDRHKTCRYVHAFRHNTRHRDGKMDRRGGRTIELVKQCRAMQLCACYNDAR